MVLHVEKTFKVTTQKNSNLRLSKSHKFAKKIYVAEFRYNQTIFFLGGGVHSNFTHDSKANDFMKFYFEILLEILVPSLLLIDYCLSQL